MAFLTVRFPDNISYGSTGGPEFNTSITIVDSGFEFGNIQWDQGRHRYDAALGVRTQTELTSLLKFFHTTRGRGHHFRYKDWLDYKSCDVEDTISSTDQILGVGDGLTTAFQLSKEYDIGILPNQRVITRPVNGSILINISGGSPNHVDGDLVETTDYTIDYNTGIVTFVVVPVIDAVLSWGGEFDVPCRFDTDTLSISLDFYQHGSTTVPIIEVKE